MTSENELSDRELEILKLVATGASNKEIAQTLVISPNTVKVHLRNIFAKIDASSRTEATLYAIRTGLIPHPVEALQGAETGAEESETSLDAGAPVKPRNLPALAWVGIAVIVVLVLAGAFWGGQFFVSGQSAATPTKAPVLEVNRWETLAPLSASRSSIPAVHYEDTIYLIGGETAQGISSDLLKLTLSTGEWSAGKSKPTPVKDVQAVLLGEEIYIPGGQTADGSLVNTVEVYDPRHDSWRSAHPLPIALSRFALAAFEGRLYLFGGWDGNSYVNTIYAYDPTSDTWTARKPMANALGFAAAVSLEGKIQVVGGTDGNTVLALNNYYFPQREDNNEEAWESRAPLPEPRQRLAIAFLASKVYVFGGEGQEESGTTPAPLQYTQGTDRWMEIKPWPADMGARLSIVPVDTQLHIFGGLLAGQTLDQHRAYQAIYNTLLPIIQGGGNEGSSQ